MNDWGFGWTAIGAIATILTCVIAYWKLGPSTKNVAKNSERVVQKGGPGTTSNRADNSKDVDQSG